MVKNLPANARDMKCRFDPWVRKIPWRRTQQPTSVFLPEESQGQRSLVGYSPQGHKESDTTEATEYTHKLRNLHLPWSELSPREGHVHVESETKQSPLFFKEPFSSSQAWARPGVY